MTNLQDEQMQKMRSVRKLTSQTEIQDEILRILSFETLNVRQKQQINNVPIKYRLAYVRALFLTDKKTKALGIKMKCYECVGFESVSKRVGSCTCRLCPLYLHRPFQNSNEPDDDFDMED